MNKKKTIVLEDARASQAAQASQFLLLLGPDGQLYCQEQIFSKLWVLQGDGKLFIHQFV